ncbi:MAG: copper homeostasis protein CutC [Bacteroidaceae bacterium]|nr:copper homeostasis protein CutC [Bacteroidaceae bacterium]
MKIEVCCPDLASVKRAIEGRADRIELCTALELDGLTPSREEIREAVALCHANGVKVHVLVRSREGNFVYNENEVRQMSDEIVMSLEEGADGIVIGALTEDGALDIPTCQKWIAVAKEWQKEQGRAELGITFHRAFDVCRNPMQALEEIIAMGCNRLLTSGQEPSAVKGIPMLKKLVEASAGRLCILAGAGVSTENYMQIVEEAGVTEVHGSFKGGVPLNVER